MWLQGVFMYPWNWDVDLFFLCFTKREIFSLLFSSAFFFFFFMTLLRFQIRIISRLSSEITKTDHTVWEVSRSGTITIIILRSVCSCQFFRSEVMEVNMDSLIDSLPSHSISYISSNPSSHRSREESSKIRDWLHL